MAQGKRLSRLSLLGMAGDGDDILQNIVDRHSILLGKLVGEVGLGNVLYGIEDPTTSSDIATHAALVGVHHTKYLDSEAVTQALAQKLDDFATPDDNTDLNATTALHGLLLKLGGGTTNFLRADGSWAAPAGGAGGDNHSPLGGYYPGVLSVSTPNAVPPQVPYEGDGFDITVLRCRVGVAASGADLKVKIWRNGTSMGEVDLGTTQEGTLTISAVTVSAGDYFEAEITQTGTSPNEGSGLVWMVAP